MIKHGVMIFLILIFDGTILRSFDINGVLPNITLLYILLVSFFVELYTALTIAVILSFLCDLSNTMPVGVSLIAYCFLVYIFNYLSSFLDFRNVTSWLLGGTIGTIVLFLFHYFIMAMLSGHFPRKTEIWTVFFFQLLYNLFFLILFYPFYKKIESTIIGKKVF